MGTLIKIVNIILISGLITTAIAVVYIALPIFGNKALIVRSGSMEPTIGVGSIVVAKQDSIYRTGDIIAFRSENNPNTIITHRITSVENEKGRTFYKTRGDANEEVDGWEVSPKNVIGKSYFTIPHFGKVMAFAKSDIGFPFLIIFPAIFVIVLEAYNIFSEIRKKMKEPNQKSGAGFSLTSLKVIVPILAMAVIIPTTWAFYNDVETSTGNVFSAAAVFPTATPSATLTPTPQISPCTTTSGATVVINEINWGGSNGDGNDEWIELCNTTNSPINLANWVVENLGTGSGPGANITITSGIIPANGYFLISALVKASSKINVDSDFVTTSVSLVNGGEQLVLKNNLGSVIDTANGTGAWFAGDNSTPKKSMERKSPVGIGTAAGSWQTATTHTNMDASGPTDEFGTPKATNGL